MKRTFFSVELAYVRLPIDDCALEFLARKQKDGIAGLDNPVWCICRSPQLGWKTSQWLEENIHFVRSVNRDKERFVPVIWNDFMNMKGRERE